MDSSPRYTGISNPNPTMLPSPTSHSSISSSSDSSRPQQPTTPTTPSRPVTRSESGNPYPTTFVQADTSSFKQVVQMLTGSSETTAKHSSSSSLKPNNTQPDPTPNSRPSHAIPPIKSINPKKHSNGSSGFRLYERRNSLKNSLKISPLNPGVFDPVNNNSIIGSTRKPEILSPSILDFPSLVLSPVTPLIPDPFDRSGSVSYSPGNCGLARNNHGINGFNNGGLLDKDAEEKAIKEKGFYLHPSPSTTPRDSEPRLLPLFPVTSPRVSGSSTASTS